MLIRVKVCTLFLSQPQSVCFTLPQISCPTLWCLFLCSLSQCSLYSHPCVNCFYISLPSSEIYLCPWHSTNTFQRSLTYTGSQFLPQFYPRAVTQGQVIIISQELLQLLAKGFPQIKSIAFYTLHATARTFLIKYRFYPAAFLYNDFPDSKGWCLKVICCLVLNS